MMYLAMRLTVVCGRAEAYNALSPCGTVDVYGIVMFSEAAPLLGGYCIPDNLPLVDRTVVP